jgi:uncharacterized membrane protein YgdD (TMEM256/DUF423 family)
MNNSDKKFWLAATVLGFLAVAIGAFGAHGLKGIIIDNQLPIERLGTFKTGVSYHFYHTFALLTALMMPISPSYRKKAASFFIIGILLFSGSLYLLAIREFIPIPTAVLGPVTPIGGLFFMAGWASLALGIWKNKKD